MPSAKKNKNKKTNEESAAAQKNRNGTLCTYIYIVIKKIRAIFCIHII